MPVSNIDLQNNTLDYGTPNGAPVSFRPIRSTLPLPVAPIAAPIKKTLLSSTAAQDPSGTGGIPKKLLSINAVESPVAQQSYTNSEVSVSFSRDPSDISFAGVQIWFTGYHGSTTPALMASGTTSPISFICDTTNETVTVQALPIGSTGLSAPLSFAISTTVKLDGIVSAPPQPTIVQEQLATPTGYQFSFDQIVLSAGDEDVIASYNVYRNTVNNASTSSVIRTIKHDPTNNGNPIVVQDIVNRGTLMWYWITAVNTKGLESSFQPAFNTGPTTYQPVLASSNVVAAQTAVGDFIQSGRVSIAFYATGQTVYLPGYVTFDVVVTDPVNPVILDVLLFSGNGGTGPFGYFFRFDSRTANNAGQILKVNNGTWSNIGTAKTSANSGNLPVGVYHVFGEYNADGTMNIFVNGVWQYTAQDTSFALTGASYYAYENAVAGIPTIAPYIQNTSKFGSGELLAQGSISSAGVQTFSYSSTSTTIKWTWTAFTIYNPDGSSYSVPANSTGTTFSGLTASTTYNFGFYVTVSTGICTVILSDVSGGTGASSAAQIQQTINGDGNVGINWNVPVATTSSGSGGGSGGGGGGGQHCFSPNTLLLDQRAISGISRGDLVWVERANGERVLRSVAEVIETDYCGMMHRVGENALVKPNHLFRRADGSWTRADELFPETKHYSGKVWNLHIETDDEQERNYVLRDGLVAHNQKMF